MKSLNQRHDEAELRNAEWRALTPAQQLAANDARLKSYQGFKDGIGGNRQRSRLSAIINKPIPVVEPPKPAIAVAETPKKKKFKKGNKQ